MELVISRFNEDLAWIKEYPYNNYPIILYNKGINDNYLKTDKTIKVNNIENVDREGHYFERALSTVFTR